MCWCMPGTRFYVCVRREGTRTEVTGTFVFSFSGNHRTRQIYEPATHVKRASKPNEMGCAYEIHLNQTFIEGRGIA